MSDRQISASSEARQKGVRLALQSAVAMLVLLCAVTGGAQTAQADEHQRACQTWFSLPGVKFSGRVLIAPDLPAESFSLERTTDAHPSNAQPVGVIKLGDGRFHSASVAGFDPITSVTFTSEGWNILKVSVPGLPPVKKAFGGIGSVERLGGAECVTEQPGWLGANGYVDLGDIVVGTPGAVSGTVSLGAAKGASATVPEVVVGIREQGIYVQVGTDGRFLLTGVAPGVRKLYVQGVPNYPAVECSVTVPNGGLLANVRMPCGTSAEPGATVTQPAGQMQSKPPVRP